MRLKSIKLLFFVTIVIMGFSSCKNEAFVQEFKNYEEYNKIVNKRLTCWFPVELIKSDAHNLKNQSYLTTKCIFGVFEYNKAEVYDSIFLAENYIDSIHTLIFQNQIKRVTNIIPEWFPEPNFWKTKNIGIVLIDNCYTYNDRKKNKIYYFHPEEESTYFNGEYYPGIRNTIR